MNLCLCRNKGTLRFLYGIFICSGCYSLLLNMFPGWNSFQWIDRFTFPLIDRWWELGPDFTIQEAETAVLVSLAAVEHIPALAWFKRVA